MEAAAAATTVRMLRKAKPGVREILFPLPADGSFCLPAPVRMGAVRKERLRLLWATGTIAADELEKARAASRAVKSWPELRKSLKLLKRAGVMEICIGEMGGGGGTGRRRRERRGGGSCGEEWEEESPPPSMSLRSLPSPLWKGGKGTRKWPRASIDAAGSGLKAGVEGSNEYNSE